MVYKLSNKETPGGAVKNENMSNQELAVELHKSFLIKFEKWKVYSPFMVNIWGDNLADMKLIRKSGKRIHFLLCVIVIFGKWAWVIFFER